LEAEAESESGAEETAVILINSRDIILKTDTGDVDVGLLEMLEWEVKQDIIFALPNDKFGFGWSEEGGSLIVIEGLVVEGGATARR